LIKSPLIATVSFMDEKKDNDGGINMPDIKRKGGWNEG